MQIKGFRTHFGTSVCYTDIATRVTLLGKFASEEVVELGTEDTVSDELALFADLAGHFGSWMSCGVRMTVSERFRGECYPKRSRRIQPSAVVQMHPAFIYSIHNLHNVDIRTFWRVACESSTPRVLTAVWSIPCLSLGPRDRALIQNFLIRKCHQAIVRPHQSEVAREAPEEFIV